MHIRIEWKTENYVYEMKTITVLEYGVSKEQAIAHKTNWKFISVGGEEATRFASTENVHNVQMMIADMRTFSTFKNHRDSIQIQNYHQQLQQI